MVLKLNNRKKKKQIESIIKIAMNAHRIADECEKIMPLSV